MKALCVWVFCGGQERWHLVQEQDLTKTFITEVTQILWNLFYELGTWGSKKLSDLTKHR